MLTSNLSQHPKSDFQLAGNPCRFMQVRKRSNLADRDPPLTLTVPTWPGFWKCSRSGDSVA